jgi:hypothetical protein
MMKYALVCLLLFLTLVGCAPTAKDTAAFCGIWKREFSPFDSNYHLLKSLENRGAELGLGPRSFDSLMEMFCVEATGPDAVMVYDHEGRYRGTVAFALGKGYVLSFSAGKRDFRCTVRDDRIAADVSDRTTKESGTMDFSVRGPLEGEVELWK